MVVFLVLLHILYFRLGYRAVLTFSFTFRMRVRLRVKRVDGEREIFQGVYELNIQFIQ